MIHTTTNLSDIGREFAIIAQRPITSVSPTAHCDSLYADTLGPAPLHESLTAEHALRAMAAEGAEDIQTAVTVADMNGLRAGNRRRFVAREYLPGIVYGALRQAFEKNAAEFHVRAGYSTHENTYGTPDDPLHAAVADAHRIVQNTVAQREAAGIFDLNAAPAGGSVADSVAVRNVAHLTRAAILDTPADVRDELLRYGRVIPQELDGATADMYVREMQNLPLSTNAREFIAVVRARTDPHNAVQHAAPALDAQDRATAGLANLLSGRAEINPVLREQRFRFAHEYCHVPHDRSAAGKELAACLSARAETLQHSMQGLERFCARAVAAAWPHPPRSPEYTEKHAQIARLQIESHALEVEAEHILVHALEQAYPGAERASIALRIAARETDNLRLQELVSIITSNSRRPDELAQALILGAQLHDDPNKRFTQYSAVLNLAESATLRAQAEYLRSACAPADGSLVHLRACINHAPDSLHALHAHREIAASGADDIQTHLERALAIANTLGNADEIAHTRLALAKMSFGYLHPAASEHLDAAVASALYFRDAAFRTKCELTRARMSLGTEAGRARLAALAETCADARFDVAMLGPDLQYRAQMPVEFDSCGRSADSFGAQMHQAAEFADDESIRNAAWHWLGRVDPGMRLFAYEQAFESGTSAQRAAVAADCTARDRVYFASYASRHGSLRTRLDGYARLREIHANGGADADSLDKRIRGVKRSVAGATDADPTQTALCHYWLGQLQIGDVGEHFARAHRLALAGGNPDLAAAAAIGSAGADPARARAHFADAARLAQSPDMQGAVALERVALGHIDARSAFEIILRRPDPLRANLSAAWLGMAKYAADPLACLRRAAYFAHTRGDRMQALRAMQSAVGAQVSAGARAVTPEFSEALQSEIRALQYGVKHEAETARNARRSSRLKRTRDM